MKKLPILEFGEKVIKKTRLIYDRCEMAVNNLGVKEVYSSEDKTRLEGICKEIGLTIIVNSIYTDYIGGLLQTIDNQKVKGEYSLGEREEARRILISALEKHRDTNNNLGVIAGKVEGILKEGLFVELN